MYSLLRRKSPRIAAIPVAVLCIAYLLCYMTVGFAATKKLVHVSGTVSVEAVSAEFTSITGADEDSSTISYNGSEVTMSVVGMRYPGASAVALITARNTGTLRATVTEVVLPDTGHDFIIAEGADVPVGEILAPGEECQFEVVVYWDPSRDDILESEETIDFSMQIVYENNDYIYVETDTSPKTGDETNTDIFGYIAIACGAVLAICIILFIVGRRKEKEDDSNEE